MKKLKWIVLLLGLTGLLAGLAACGNGIEFGAKEFVLKGAGS